MGELVEVRCYLNSHREAIVAAKFSYCNFRPAAPPLR